MKTQKKSYPKFIAKPKNRHDQRQEKPKVFDKSNSKGSDCFIGSAALPSDYPKVILPEIAITGRSNAGKSSLINTWMGSQVARVSSTPGKTRLLNFFHCGKYTLVDMPGYGYAARSKTELESFRGMVEPYLQLRENLSVLLIVMDVRRDWADEEVQLRDYAYAIGKPVVLVATKVDKLKKNEIAKRKMELEKQSALSHVYLVSSLSKAGIIELEDAVYRGFLRK